MNTISPSLLIRVHLTDGSAESFAQNDPEKARAIWQRVDPGVENQAFMRFQLSRTGFRMRLSSGGISVVNLANLAGYSVCPGVAQIRADSWIAEPTNTANQLQQ